MSTRIFRTTVLAGAIALAAGCASDGGLKPQAHLQDANQLQAGATMARMEVSPAAWPARDWWRRYSDAQLDRIVDEALAASPNMRAAEARVRQAAAVAEITGAALSPQVTGGARSNRVEFSGNSNAPKPLAGSWKWSNEASLNFGYELDFWGKNQAALDAAVGRQKAAEVEAEAARLLLTVGITQTYLKLSAAVCAARLGRAGVETTPSGAGTDRPACRRQHRFASRFEAGRAGDSDCTNRYRHNGRSDCLGA
jgi:outer membrane protein TolC